MKRLLLPLLLALGACSQAPPPAAPAAGPDPSLGGARAGTWVRAEGERKGQAMIWTYREDFVPDAARPRLLVVSQGVEAATSSQVMQPLQPELDQREKRLREGLRGKAELVAVLDWDQQHDWYFYAVPELASDEVTALLGDVKFADIRTTLEDDPAFDFYRTLLKRVGGQSH
ncbi:hypothetical protein [Tahibacter harae]|uniref:Apolipoprotein D and lipocalin family protein n=1 Tax=Tahibacter harae TaxID=2963937 RepID=A0ABT1QPR0_9GAMM|nr:hypothetical protein [Tahibacter harae]MCQ4164262.1 hypothetical protein [Tahibacter harae]